MPTAFDTVIVFGDSLSDIGRKWTTKAGRAGRFFREMTVNATGRFSECRNWTDYMVEAAGNSLFEGSAKATEAESLKHTHLSKDAIIPLPTGESWLYLNYAVGGACGDTPHKKESFLSTFEEQVDEFIAQYQATQVVCL